MINGVSAASESSARIRSPMEFPWLLYWISFKFVTLSGAMLIAARYESSRLRGVHLSFRGEESLSLPRARARARARQRPSNSTLFCALGTIHTFVKLSLSPAYPVTLPIVVSEMNLLPRSSASIKRGETRTHESTAHQVPFLFPPRISRSGNRSDSLVSTLLASYIISRTRRDGSILFFFFFFFTLYGTTYSVTAEWALMNVGRDTRALPRG